MAVLSDYTSGTITLANGSTAVTGTGTLFEVTRFREGDTLQIQNLTAVIASVNSNTSLTLTEPWTGTTLTNAIYRARYLPDGARVTAQATTLIELLGSGNLQSIAGLTGAADKGLMFTGEGTAGTFDLTEFARSLLKSANGNAFYAAIGEVPSEQLPPRIQSISILVTDADTAVENGWYRAEGSAANTPLNTVGFIQVITQTSTVLKQIWYQRDGTRVFMRTRVGGAFSGWTETASNVTAASLALLNLSGTPTANQLPFFDGANSAALTPLTAFARTVIDDANGPAMFATMGATQSFGTIGYTRLPNGLIMQWGTSTPTTSSGGYGSITFPITFVNTNWVSTVMNGDAATQPTMLVLKNRALLAANRIDIRVVNSTTGNPITDTAVRVDWIAFGG